MKRRLIGSALAGTLAPALAFGVGFAGAMPDAQAKPDARCHVRAIAALKQERKDGTPRIGDDLKGLKKQLRDDAFAAYKSFHLIEGKKLKLSIGEAVRWNTGKTGNRVDLTLLNKGKQKLKLHLDLAKGPKKLMSTDLSITDGGAVIVRAGKHQVGEVTATLFFAVQCAKTKDD